MLVTGVDGGVGVAVHLSPDCLVDGLLDLELGRPDVTQVDLVPLGIQADRIAVKIDIHSAGNRIGDHQWRGHQIVRLDIGVDTSLEVPVAGEHRADDQVPLGYRVGDLGWKRTGVADTCSAAVADGMEAELVEILRQARLVVVLGDDLRAGSQRGLHPWLR